MFDTPVSSPAAEKAPAVQTITDTDFSDTLFPPEDETHQAFSADDSIPAAEPPPAADTETKVPELDRLRKMIREELEVQMLESAEQIEVEFAKLRSLLSESVDKDKMLEEKDELFRRVYAELKKHQGGLERAIITPVLKSAVKWYERVASMCKYYTACAPAEEGENRTPYADLLREFSSFGDCILDTLSNHDVEIIDPAVGDAFDPSIHSALEAQPCTEAEKNSTIAEVHSPGFRYSSDGKILQFAKVSVFKYIQQGE